MAERGAAWRAGRRAGPGAGLSRGSDAGADRRQLIVERPLAHLKGVRGVLQVDGYAGHRALAERATRAWPSAGAACAVRL